MSAPSLNLIALVLGGAAGAVAAGLGVRLARRHAREKFPEHDGHGAPVPPNGYADHAQAAAQSLDGDYGATVQASARAL